MLRRRAFCCKTAKEPQQLSRHFRIHGFRGICLHRTKKAGMRSGRAKRSDCIPDAVAVPRIKDKAEIAALTEFLRDSFLDFSDESRLNEFLHEIRRMSDGRIVYAPFTFHENLLRLRILSLGVEVGELLNPATRFLLRATGCIFAMKSVYHMIRMNFADIFPEILYPFRSICAVLRRFPLTAVHSVTARRLMGCLRIIFPKDLRSRRSFWQPVVFCADFCAVRLCIDNKLIGLCPFLCCIPRHVVI